MGLARNGAALVALLVAYVCFVDAVPMEYFSYGEIVARMKALEAEFPEFVEVFAAQDRFPEYVTSPAKGKQTPCKQWFIRITNEVDLADYPERPEVFFSGNLHGDEDVGPMTLIYTAELLVRLRAADTNPWISRMVNTRSIMLLPMSNALGYENIVREENGVDPNRDFPFDNLRGGDPGLVGWENECMVTNTARAINEVWRLHMFQLAITFHGGMQAIAYEWGTSQSHRENGAESPDDASMSQMAKIMSDYAGTFQGSKYPHDRLTPLVYPVSGGMEDWAYAASWDLENVRQCTPDNGYPPSRTSYTPDMLRAFNFLVETWDAKRPPAHQLGNVPSKLADLIQGQGHVPRNLRLALFFIDLVQPYVQWTHLSASSSASGSPGLRRLASASIDATALHASQPAQLRLDDATASSFTVDMQYTIGGAVTVDEAQVFWGRWSEDVAFPSAMHSLSGVSSSSIPADWASVLQGGSPGPTVHTTTLRSGTTQWGEASLPNLADAPYTTLFGASVEVPASDGVFVFVARVRVDSGWKEHTNNPTPNLPPQSHFVNARTNPEWNRTNNGHIVKGQTHWISQPLVVAFNTELPTWSFVDAPVPTDVSPPPTKASSMSLIPTQYAILGVGAVVLVLIAVALVVRRRRAYLHVHTSAPDSGIAMSAAGVDSADNNGAETAGNGGGDGGVLDSDSDGDDAHSAWTDDHEGDGGVVTFDFTNDDDDAPGAVAVSPPPAPPPPPLHATHVEDGHPAATPAAVLVSVNTEMGSQA